MIQPQRSINIVAGSNYIIHGSCEISATLPQTRGGRERSPPKNRRDCSRRRTARSSDARPPVGRKAAVTTRLKTTSVEFSLVRSEKLCCGAVALDRRRGAIQRFRDTVIAQTAAVLMNRGSSRAVHAVDNMPEEENYRDAIFKILDSSGGSPQATIDELIGALQAVLNYV